MQQLMQLTAAAGIVDVKPSAAAVGAVKAAVAPVSCCSC